MNKSTIWAIVGVALGVLVISSMVLVKPRGLELGHIVPPPNFPSTLPPPLVPHTKGVPATITENGITYYYCGVDYREVRVGGETHYERYYMFCSDDPGVTISKHEIEFIKVR